MITRRHFIAGASGLVVGASLAQNGWAAAESSANRLLYGYPAGGVGTKLGLGCLKLLEAAGGPAYHMENIDGRNTRLASEMASKAPADGKTVLQVISGSLTLAPSIYTHPTFDPLHDFRPLAVHGDFPYMFAVGAMVPATINNLHDYLDWVSDNPDARNIGVPIYGSVGYLATRILARDTGSTLRVQSYRDTAAVLDDLHKQNISAAFLAPGNGVSVAANAPVRAIGVTSAEPLDFWPHIAPLKDQGVANMDLTGWFGWFAPAATPDSAVTPLLDKIHTLQANPAYLQLLNSLYLKPAPLNPAQITARITKEIGRYRDLVRAYSIKPLD